MKRRSFIKNIGYSAVMGSVTSPLWNPLSSTFLKEELAYLTILHTNDVHSRIEPFPDNGSRNGGKGGAARRASLIQSIRDVEEHVLLLDSGDIFQGTPYFNFFGGELEFQLMDEMGYDAATMGNHDFDAGIDVLAERCDKAKFDMLNYNYDLKDTPLKDVVKPYKIFTKGEMRIGVFGIGIELNGLVPKNLTGNVQYNEPYERAEKIATHLKKVEKCDLVICLSHLGYLYETNRPSDVRMARTTRNIDIILGGHTHTFLRDIDQRKNKDGETVLINQVGWAGLMLGRIDVILEKNQKNKCFSCKNEFLQEPIDNSNIKHN